MALARTALAVRRPLFTVLVLILVPVLIVLVPVLILVLILISVLVLFVSVLILVSSHLYFSSERGKDWSVDLTEPELGPGDF